MNPLRISENRIWLHIAFWGAWIALWTTLFGREMAMLQALAQALLLAAAYSIFVYLNLRLAIPRILWTGKYGWYVLVQVLLIGTGGLAVWQLLLLLSLGEVFENQKPVVSAISSAANVLFMLFFTSSLKLGLNSLEQQQTNRQLENQQLQTELNFLKSQVNPHFLFNTLNNLYSLALTKSDRAPEVVLKLSAILRYMLYECNERMVYLNKELEYLRNYIELEELRQDGTNLIELQVQGNTDRKMIAPLLFTPLLENAIKHGLNRTTASAWVRMHLEVSAMDLSFTIVNSKAPQSAFHQTPMPNPVLVAEQATRSGVRTGGIGLLNVKRRLDLIYPNRHAFAVSETAETYTVTLKLTLAE
jgi:LytS/YehU family sensor histidine kinase